MPVQRIPLSGSTGYYTTRSLTTCVCIELRSMHALESPTTYTVLARGGGGRFKPIGPRSNCRLPKLTYADVEEGGRDKGHAG
jgi:hypothetical protein